MKVRIFLTLVVFFSLGTVWGFYLSSRGFLSHQGLLSPLVPAPSEVPRPLQKYSFESLRQRKFEPMAIELIESFDFTQGKSEDGFESWLFRFETEKGQVSGQANVPKKCSLDQVQSSPASPSEAPLSGGEAGRAKSKVQNVKNESSKCPVIVMLRGYVDKEEYQTGIGTRNAAAVFARNGYVTLAPDFLGYGLSDPEPKDELEARFQRVVTLLQLLASLKGPSTSAGTGRHLPSLGMADPNRIGLWAHSNGGQIVLSVLAITSQEIPTTLWAPVSKPFPYSILYYTDELEDHGRYLRKLLADFEAIYDVEEFSVTNYFDLIQAPIQVHQGTADDAVPLEWSDELVEALYSSEVSYFVYPGADHNLSPSWDTAIERDLYFFASP